MRFEYFEALSGDPIYIEGVGRIRSPRLRELFPTSGIGQQVYNIYLNLLVWDKEQIIKYDRIMKYTGVGRLERKELQAFDVVTLLKQTRELYRDLLSFFMVENLIWDDKNRCYLVMTEESTPRVIGAIHRDNFEEVRVAMLQLNYVKLDEAKPVIAHSSKEAAELWEKAQKFLTEQAKKAPKEEHKPELQLGNIISKICATHPSYNLFNIFDLTVFQLYDAFFQIGFMRGTELNERIFCNHGGEKFKFENWLKPILKNI